MNECYPKELFSIHSTAFRTYGRIVTGLNCKQMKSALDRTDAPTDRVEYVASFDGFETSAEFLALQNSFFGGIPCQAGYCNGYTTHVNTMEYHRCSEFMILGSEAVLILGHRWDIDNNLYDFHNHQAFFAPSGTVIELFATTLHYSPCAAQPQKPFRAIIILPYGTNSAFECALPDSMDSRIFSAKNKWIVTSPYSVDILPLISQRMQ